MNATIGDEEEAFKLTMNSTEVFGKKGKCVKSGLVLSFLTCAIIMITRRPSHNHIPPPGLLGNGQKHLERLLETAESQKVLESTLFHRPAYQ